ncbi:ROK family protein [Occultella aeris]|uniref:ROK family protein n=1 Tax=Occultella aeris TaxID=2761496 RepID=UPI0012EA19B2|nr:ROK family protein [Occultella aeris]
MSARGGSGTERGVHPERPRLGGAGLLRRPVRQQSLRHSNLALVASHIFTADEPVSRAQIVAASGLTRATVSRLVEALLAAAVVEEREPPPSRGAGRPVRPLAPAAGTHVALGLEVNTTSLGGCLVDLAGNVVAERIVDGDYFASDPTAVLADLATLAVALLTGPSASGLRHVGSHVSLPGAVDRGTIVVARKLGWHDVDILGRLGENARLGARPLRLGSVGPMSALAESRYRETSSGGGSFAWVSGDNSVGSSIIVDGQLITDVKGWDGNVGSIPVGGTVVGGRPLQRHALDDYVGRRALLRRAGLPPTTTIEELAEIAHAGTVPALQTALSDAGAALGDVVATMMTLVSTPVVVFGDTLAAILPFVGDQVDVALRQRLPAGHVVRPRLEASITSSHAAMRGGALSILEEALADAERWLVRPGDLSG